MPVCRTNLLFVLWGKSRLPEVEWLRRNRCHRQRLSDWRVVHSDGDG
jgi:hypothetical protein